MRGIAEACGELVADLRTADFRADVDPANLVTDPGCIWVQPRSVSELTLGGGGTLMVWLYLIVADVETTQAMLLLDDTLAGVLELDLAFAGTDPVIDLAAAVILPSNPTKPLPAYRVAVELDL